VATRLAVASTAACTAGGIAVADGAALRHSWEVAIIGLSLLVAGGFGALTATGLRLLRVVERRSSMEREKISEERRVVKTLLREGQEALDKRERRLRREEATNALRITSYATSIDYTRTDNNKLRSRMHELEVEIADLNDERNQLVTQELTATRAQFVTKGYGVMATGKAPSTYFPTVRPADAGEPAPEGKLRRIDTT
jgi:polyhydroxyalkanoate synthesis regulator phasin